VLNETSVLFDLWLSTLVWRRGRESFFVDKLKKTQHSSEAPQALSYF